MEYGSPHVREIFVLLSNMQVEKEDIIFMKIELLNFNFLLQLCPPSIGCIQSYYARFHVERDGVFIN